MVVKAHVAAEQGDDRRGHGLGHVARRQGGTQPLLGLGAAQEDDAQRGRVGGSWPPLEKLVQMGQRSVVDRFVDEAVVTADGNVRDSKGFTAR